MITTSPPPAAVSSAPASDIRDIKPPVAIPSGWEWVWWALGALAVLAVLLLLWRLWKKRRSRIRVAPPVPAHVRARRVLEEALGLITQPKPFCTLVSDTVRVYLEERFDFRAPERTTEEFLLELQGTNLLTVAQKEWLGKFLESCDLVKFAKYEPGEPELRELHSSALKLVEETEPRETETEGAGVARVEPGVAPDSSPDQNDPARESVGQDFQQDAGNGTRDARAPQSEIVNRKPEIHNSE